MIRVFNLRAVRVALLASISLGVSFSATAAPVLFNATGNKCGLYICGAFGGPYGSGSTATGVAEVTGSAPANVSLPGRVMVSGPWTYTAVLTGYPYFFAEVYRRLGTGDFDADYWPAGGTSNQERNETAYPNAAPTTVADAYVQMSFGQNGFGGPMAFFRDEVYIGLVTGVGVGSSDLIVDFTAMLHSGHEERWAFETRTNNQTLGVNGVVWAWNPTNPFMTGTAKIYAPTGVISHITTFTGADNRNNAGTTGTLSLIAPGIIASFGITGQAPPRTLDQHMDSLITTAREMFTLNLTFTPEPTQFALLGSGVIALLGLGWLRRR